MRTFALSGFLYCNIPDLFLLLVRLKICLLVFFVKKLIRQQLQQTEIQS